MANEPKIEYVPDYDSKCCNCEQSPVVDVHQNGVFVHSTDMCGPCTFGDASTTDPDEW